MTPAAHHDPADGERHFARAVQQALLRETGAAAVVVAASSLRVLEANPAAQSLWGGAAFVVGRPVELARLQAHHADGRPVAPSEWPLRGALERGEEARGHRLRVAGHGGDERWLQQACVPVRDRDGRVAAALWVLEDVTAEERAQAQQRRVVEFRDHFLKIVSHDLRSPLGAISLGVGSLLRAGGLTERQEKILHRVNHSSQRLERMIRDAVDYSRGHLGLALPLHAQATPLGETARRAVAEAQAEHPGRQLSVDVAADGVGTWDGPRVQHVLGVLLDNALAYSPAGSPVSLRVAREGGEVVFAVHNAGALTADVRAVLFHPFRKLDTVHPRPRALGLGLHVATLVAGAHGGSIDADSGEHGTTVTLRLPLVTD